MPRLVKADCPGCGANIDIRKADSYVTCAYCGAQSWVQRPDAPRPPPANHHVVTLSREQSRRLAGGIVASVSALVVGGIGLFLIIFLVGMGLIIAATLGLIHFMSGLQ
ncbi:MAG: hypothetical protein JRI23_23745 [Deltaproteobacteria bacterium]|jgi:hypothetical protein|nr:hypothetical protein [Deltaproteobacteria bacterium]MBW2535006.1 hypothetical protein [Deltaproteobacteria bacterium]